MDMLYIMNHMDELCIPSYQYSIISCHGSTMYVLVTMFSIYLWSSMSMPTSGMLSSQMILYHLIPSDPSSFLSLHTRILTSEFYYNVFWPSVTLLTSCIRGAFVINLFCSLGLFLLIHYVVDVFAFFLSTLFPVFYFQPHTTPLVSEVGTFQCA